MTIIKIFVFIIVVVLISILKDKIQNDIWLKRVRTILFFILFINLVFSIKIVDENFVNGTLLFSLAILYPDDDLIRNMKERIYRKNDVGTQGINRIREK